MLVQLPALFHCQLPWAAVAALAVMTTPRRVLADEPPETVSVVSEKRAEKRLVTVSPAGLVVSSMTAVRVAEPEATGASLTAVMEIETASVMEENAVVPPLTETLTFDPAVPLEPSQARNVRASAVVPLTFALGW